MSNKATPADDQGQGDQGKEAEVQGLAEYNAGILDSAPGVREAFREMLLHVPEPDPDADQATIKIVAQILAAQTAGDLDKPWDSDGMRHHFDQMLTVRSITRRPSDYTGGLGAYLGCDCILNETGEEQFITCGSVSCVAQLVRAHTLQVLPLIVIPRKANKPTPKGYWPYHLEVQGRVQLP